MPSYVDDVIEGTYVSATSFKNTSDTAVTGESGKIYVDTTSGKTYRWSGSAFVVISETLALGETSSTAYRGDRGKVAYDHSQTTGNPHGTTAEQVGALPITGGTISGDLGVNGKLVQGTPNADASIASMNRLASDLFIEGNGSAPNNPQVAGFYLGKSATDGNRHLDIVSGDTYSYIDFNKADKKSDYDVRLLVNVANGDTQFMWGTDGALTQKLFNVVGGTLMQNGTPVALVSDVTALETRLSTLENSVVSVLSGTAEPTANIGEDGDIYLVTG